MATQTEYVLPTSDAAAVSVGTTSRQWMMPQGGYVNETVSGGGAVADDPVVQSCG